ncbi:TonB-dependent receptor [uncultured Bacteroides sp.]|uniref:SusC/RagA family TonB-linked outer membrane protein n=1 Tax=uncultured Bacteroides sp. TaxID=162156 RepID=UPI00280A78DC|nr:TonB-dependent receptor [uncultured Bacteroides sp.]
MKHLFVFLLLFIGIGTVTAQNVQVTGIVKDNSGEAVIGANVTVKGSTNGTITDLDGKFSVQASPNATLVISFIGYTTQEIKLQGKTNVTVTLTEDSKALDEVVVIGYGTQKKVNLTGSVAAVKIDETIASRSITNVSSSLSGLVPGLVVSQSTGFAGGDGASLKVRGLGSINNSDPLIVVDGMPDVDINRINMNDIESISVLKDAASSAVYGSRAANGVILITTKSGLKESKAKVSYNGSYAWSSPVEFYDYMADYSRALTMHMRAAASGNSSTNYRQASAEQWLAMSMVDPILFPNTDQFDEMFRTGAIQNHTVSASGGSDKMNFYTSIGIMDQEGLQIHNDYSRYNMRLNLDYKIHDNVKIGVKTDGTWSERQTPRGSGLETGGLKYVISGVLNQHPETGEYGGSMAYGENTSAGNAIAEYEAYRTNTSRKEFNGNAYIEWEPLKDLKLNVSYALRYYNEFSKTVQNVIKQMNFQTGEVSRTMPDTGDLINNSNYEGHKTLFQGRISYEKEIAKGHHIAAMFNAAEEYWYNRSLYAQRKNRLHNSLEEIDAASPSEQTNSGSSNSEGLRSFIGRFNYTMFDKYLFEFTFRSDGSSRFAKGHQWGFFPSAAIGWRISEEKFFEPLKRTVSNAKFRASYGTLGNNSGVGRYEQKETMSTTNYVVGNNTLVTGFSANKMVNKDLSWEETRVFNVGLDLGFFNNQLTAELDWYDRFTTGMIRGSSISSLLTGYSAPRINVADLRNRGVEANITWRSKIRKFDYSINVNASYNVNKLEKWGDHLDRGWTMLDMPYHFLYIYEAYPGLVQSWGEIANAPYQGNDHIAPGDIMIKDINGDGQISDLDKKAYTNKYRDTPMGQFGITLTGAYKGFDIQALFQGNYGRTDLWLDDLNTNTIPQDRYAFQQFHWNDTWSLDNRNASLPRIVTGNQGSRNREESTFYAYNTNYLRLKNLQIGYSIPERYMQKIGFNRARIYLSGENILTMTPWKGIDPEKPHGNDFYPLVKTYSVGLNIEF